MSKISFTKKKKIDFEKIINALGQLIHCRNGLDNRFIDYPTSEFIVDWYCDINILNDVFITEKENDCIVINIGSIHLRLTESLKKINTINMIMSDDLWYRKPTGEWYNDEKECGQMGLMSSRKYVEVVKPFNEIVLHRKLKGADLTCDDIMFAMRGFSGDGWDHIIDVDRQFRVNKVDDVLNITRCK